MKQFQNNKRTLLLLFLFIIITIISLLASFRLRFIVGKHVHKLAGIMGLTIDGVPGFLIVSGTKDGFLYFPDICKTKNGLLLAYYCNKTHAPRIKGDPLGVIFLKKGDESGLKWDISQPLIDKNFLISNGLGVWVSKSGLIFTSEDTAEQNEAEFAVEGRDPNLFVLSNGIVILTFFTRVIRDNTLRYTYGNSYMMVSYDNAKTWTKPQIITCKLLDQGCAKRGTIAELDNGEILIPLYGFNSNFPDIFTTAIIKGRIDRRGLLSILKEYNGKHVVNQIGLFINGETEVSLLAVSRNVYAFCRKTGNLYISEDSGETWRLIGTVNNKDKKTEIMQPCIISISDSLLLLNWTKWIDANNRAIFGRLYDIRFNNLDYYKDKIVYSDYYGVDMGDPTSIILDNGNVLTAFYDVNVNAICGRILNVRFFE